ncbi:hypothetical protein DCAR_0208087 [Daucus carota subsp. sativus]|uniref:Replication factor A C-terminal domain-containing protein n=1 Tax=Daucus carota subsp. sativus TaxID=79200 RepID=A0AAF0WFA0_DAUCS|nr:hypothetical protein DCAR_0208087 [Daucus carota subsp. sativus]
MWLVIYRTPILNVSILTMTSQNHILSSKLVMEGKNIRVTFFDQLAEEFEKQVKLFKGHEPSIIISCAKVNEYEGVTCLNNYPATRFYLNPDHYSVKDLMKRVEQLPVASDNYVEEMAVTEQPEDVKIYTVAEIKDFGVPYIERIIRCQLNVKKVEEKNMWYDDVCSSCEKQVDILDGRYKCLECKRSIPFPEKRFRLATVCKDSTGCLAVLFPHEEIQRIIGKDVFDIENDDTQVGESFPFPPILKSFERKDFLISLKIADKNVNKSSNVYIAHSLEEPPEMLGDHNPSENNTSPVPDVLTMDNSLKPLKRSSDTPSTEKSSNRPKTRRQVTPVNCELDENLTMAAMLKVKKEKRGRIHAFVPGSVAESIERDIAVGKVFLIENFTVKDYEASDIFRPFAKEIQIVFDDQTRITQLDEEKVYIDQFVFDLYDLADLEPQSKQRKYLIDVLGIIVEKPKPLSLIKNKNGQLQHQFKFRITDGSNIVKVTFWDEFAVYFDQLLKQKFDYPLIIIIGSCKVTKWNEELDIGNAGPTTVHINIKHHGVNEMKKRLNSPGFNKSNLYVPTSRFPKLLTVAEIKTTTAEFIEVEFLVQVSIKKVQQVNSWFDYVCTSCYKVVSTVGNVFKCEECKRNVTYPDKKFQVCVFASDESGAIDIMLENREIQTLIGKTVFDLIDEGCVANMIPGIMKSIENKDFTIKILIQKENILNKYPIYLATDIMHGFDIQYDSEPDDVPQPILHNDTQPSGSTYHLETLSGISNPMEGDDLSTAN